MFVARRSGIASRRTAFTDNFAFLLPVIMLTFGCTFLVVAGSDPREYRHWGDRAKSFLLLRFLPMTPVEAPAPWHRLSPMRYFRLSMAARSCATLADLLAALRLAFSASIYARTSTRSSLRRAFWAELLLHDLAWASLLGFALVNMARRAKH
ncbi:hypothetical protein AM571_CH02290 [Rhizobium etli 8C-3]|uniref:Uncharacterized protein n=3 Tax=Rhizobium/Agrobacterium group TaxID=227290 RepID=A0A1L5P4Q1_RHIET|nr:hypothetical protein AM571_CH02290 [Rhizobium etli 8C-3]TCU25746.1 hypothetical protein EV130_105404 [Rhizobium azibense]